MVYLDHAATTPVRAGALEAFVRHAHAPGNASSLHADGRAARRVVEESRERVAEALGADPGEVVFTSGGTEADNLGVKGLYWAARAADPRRVRILTSPVEHHAVLDSIAWLQAAHGAVVQDIPVDGHGRIEVAALRELLLADPTTVACIVVMWANNEVGTVQPVAEVAALAAEFAVPLHVDGVQAIGALPTDFRSTGMDSLAVSGHKLGAPIGVGALLLTRRAKPVPVLHGGGQERDVRSGTLATALIAAFADAIAAAQAAQVHEARRLTQLRDDLVARVRGAVPDAVYNGDPVNRLPGNAHFSFPGCEGDSLLMLLDAAGVCCSTGSACNAGIPQPSHVLLAMGVDPVLARGSLRFSLGHTSTAADVDALVAALPAAVQRAKRAGVMTR